MELPRVLHVVVCCTAGLTCFELHLSSCFVSVNMCPPFPTGGRGLRHRARLTWAGATHLLELDFDPPSAREDNGRPARGGPKAKRKESDSWAQASFAVLPSRINDFIGQ
ncbi:Hypothetical predicted protein [Podarcis lilfordi]|uniref:Uncharacterized protein n=1 Tax=Podarcis lilfordi TaxID=74358 RepID=A0AA35NVD4_9SAUR|nr:Hypothetical predicted protein [Podarcis lilfordi]